MSRAANPFFLNTFSNACRRIVGCVVVLVTLHGCALFSGGPKIGQADVGGFAVKGRIAVRNGDTGFSSNFLWQHADGRDEIDLWGPMGQGHSRMVDVDGRVTVYAANGETYSESDANAAMQRWLGFSLPIVALTHWIRGERAPGYAVVDAKTDPTGDLATLDQLAWRLEYSDYRANAEGARLPGRIVATNGSVKVTLLPSEWSFGTPFERTSSERSSGAPHGVDAFDTPEVDHQNTALPRIGHEPAQAEINVESTLLGASPSGKAAGFDPAIPRFES